MFTEDYIHKEVVTDDADNLLPFLGQTGNYAEPWDKTNSKTNIIISNNILEQKKVLLQSLRVVLPLREYIFKWRRTMQI